MTIDLEQLDNLVADSDKIFLSAEAEQVLMKLLDIQKQVEEAIDAAEKKLEETGLKLNPDFKSIEADKIRVYYRAYGTRYKIDDSLVEQIPAELYTTKKVYSADTKAIEKYADEHKGLPVGIIEPERVKKLTFSLKDKHNSEDA